MKLTHKVIFRVELVFNKRRHEKTTPKTMCVNWDLRMKRNTLWCNEKKTNKENDM